MFPPPRLLLALASAVLALPVGAQTAAADPLDAVLGKWRGTVGTSANNSDWALEVKRDEKGAVRGYVYHHLINFYGLDGGEVRFVDGEYELPPFEWRVKLIDGQLIGRETGPLKFNLDLRRTDSLPAEVPVPDLPAGPGPKWSQKLGGQIYAPAAVRDGVAYVGSTNGIFNAVSLKDGQILWAFPAGRPIHGEALVTDQHLFFACDNGFLFKLARADGKEVWRYDLGDAQAPRMLMHQTIFFWDYKSPKPAFADGILYLGAGDGGFHAVNADTGQRVWRFAAKDRIRGDALVVGDKVIFGSHDNNLYAVRRSDGTEVWKRTVGPVNTPITLVNGLAAFGTRGTIVATVDPETGKTAWRSFLWGSAGESGMVQFGDRAYAGSSDLRRVTEFDSATGKVNWRCDIFGIAWGQPAATEKFVYATAGGYEPYQMRHLGSLCAIDRATGKLVWRWAAPRAAHQYETGFAAGATLADGLLVVGSMDGTLYAFPAEQ